MRQPQSLEHILLDFPFSVVCWSHSYWPINLSRLGILSTSELVKKVIFPSKYLRLSKDDGGQFTLFTAMSLDKIWWVRNLVAFERKELATSVQFYWTHSDANTCLVLDMCLHPTLSSEIGHWTQVVSFLKSVHWTLWKQQWKYIKKLLESLICLAIFAFHWKLQKIKLDSSSVRLVQGKLWSCSHSSLKFPSCGSLQKWQGGYHFCLLYSASSLRTLLPNSKCCLFGYFYGNRTQVQLCLL